MSTEIKEYINSKVNNNSMNTFYKLTTGDELKKLYDVLSGKGFVNWLTNLFTKPSDCVSSLRAYPIKTLQLGFDGTSYHPATIIGGKGFALATNDILSAVSRSVIGYYQFPKATSFVDYFATIELYIPYMDFIQLPASELYGNTLWVSYVIDLATGTATAFIEVVNQQGEKHLIASKTSKIGVDIAWGFDNSVENTRNIINTVISTAVESFADSKKVGETTAKGLLTISNYLQTRFARGNSAGSIATMFNPQSTYLIIKKPHLVEVDEDDYRSVYGKPLYESRVFSQLQGYTVIDEVHLSNLPDALEEEVNEIETLLKSGVHF